MKNHHFLPQPSFLSRSPSRITDITAPWGSSGRLRRERSRWAWRTKGPRWSPILQGIFCDRAASRHPLFPEKNQGNVFSPLPRNLWRTMSWKTCSHPYLQGNWRSYILVSERGIPGSFSLNQFFVWLLTIQVKIRLPQKWLLQRICSLQVYFHGRTWWWSKIHRVDRASLNL